MLSTVSPITFCCALSQSMITRVHRSISLCAPFGILHQVDHEVRRAAHKSRRAQRPARGHHGQDVAGIQNALPCHLDAVQRQPRKRVGLHFVLGKVVDVFQAIERVILARRVVLPELDLRAQHRGLRRHPVLHPPRRDEDDVRELAHDLQIGLKPELGIEEIIQVLDARGSPESTGCRRSAPSESCPSFRGAPLA